MSQKLRDVLVTWTVVYPIITGLLTLLEPLMEHWALPLRTLLLSMIMVPLVVIWGMSIATRLLQRLRLTKAGEAAVSQNP